jgi:hypothetical protein
MKSSHWTSEDIKQIKSLGVNLKEISRQLELFRNPPSFIELERPAQVGDGIQRLSPAQKKEALITYQKAVRRGKFTKFVPASGAASRMFHLFMKFLQREPFSAASLKAEVLRGEKESQQFLEFMESLSKIAFFDELGHTLSKQRLDLEILRREERFQDILKALLMPEGLNYSQKPKGLIQFHAYSSEKRTPLEEHLVEGIQYVKDRAKRCRIHFTVSEEHKDQCRDHFMLVREKYEKKYGVKFDIGFSIQDSSTNTLAVDPDNQPFHDGKGKLVFRPSGHGALLENLNRLRGDLIYIKNIDNVTLEQHLGTTVQWKKMLGGHLAGIQTHLFRILARLHKGKIEKSALKEAEEFARRTLGLDPGVDFKLIAKGQQAKRLKELLNRPIRVCGVVPARGEPGGGPFWVRDGEGKISLQIIESAQVDWANLGQKNKFESSTHFNPVDLVCGVRDWKGRPFDLRKYRDPNAVFISHKSFEGRELKALELPGLWNGAMADWVTLFVEVPSETFTPVKTVFDLLKPAHQP